MQRSTYKELLIYRAWGTCGFFGQMVSTSGLTTVLSAATYLVSSGNNIASRVVAYHEQRQILKRDKQRVAAYEVKGRQVATGNGVSCP